jgi:DNA primase
MPTPVEQIKERLSIVEVVGSYLKLEKSGSAYRALCPFHHERTPSFHISPSRDGFYCFGCNRGGDIFTFVEEIEGVQFPEALRILADRAGVVLRRDPSESGGERDRLFAIMDDAAKRYAAELQKHPDALAYLEGRGLTKESIAAWRIGFSPSVEQVGWRFIHDALTKLGHAPKDIAAAGLTKETEKGYYDRLRSRIMFPVADGQGRVVAFTGRIFGEAPPDVGKYVNSPETPLYDKSAVLFAFDRAKTAIRRQNFAILVEGQMDCLMAHQVGTENTVAVSGTALTERHLALIKRLTDNVVFAFDADDAGIAAAGRAYALALAAGLNVRVARVPGEKDPADLILKEPAKWAEVIAASEHIVAFELSVLSDRHKDARALRDAVRRDVLPLVRSIPGAIERAHWVIEIARRLGVPERAVEEDLQRAEGPVVPSERSESEGRTSVARDPKTPRVRAEEALVGILLWQEGHPEPVLDVVLIRQRYEERLAAHGERPLSPSEGEHAALVIRAENSYPHHPSLRETAEEMLDTIESEVLRERQATLMSEIARAEGEGKKEEARAKLDEYQGITPRVLALEDRRRARGVIEPVMKTSSSSASTMQEAPWAKGRTKKDLAEEGVGTDRPVAQQSQPLAGDMDLDELFSDDPPGDPDP